LVIENRGQEAVGVDLGHNRKSKLQFVIVDPDGVETNAPRLSEAGFGRVGRVRVEPAAEYRQRIIVSEWYTFARPGTYTLKGRLVDPVTTQVGVSVGNTFESARIEILPENTAAIESICQQLVARTKVSSSAEDAAEASVALGYVRNPLVVPYLRQVLEEGTPDAKLNAAAALGQLGTADAISGLLANVDAANTDVREVVLRSLRVARAKTEDAELKRRIDDAVGGRTR